MFRFSSPLQNIGYKHGSTNSAQVLGARVPSYKNYNPRTHEILTLYRDFWRIVMQHPPHEQPDLAVKLRNEFRKGRLTKGAHQIQKLIVKAEQQLNFWRGIVDSKTTRYEGKCVPLLQPTAHMRIGRSEQNNKVRTGKNVSSSSTSSGNTNGNNNSNNKYISVKAETVDGSWSALQNMAQGSVPGLRNMKRSSKYRRPKVSNTNWTMGAM